MVKISVYYEECQDAASAGLWISGEWRTSVCCHCQWWPLKIPRADTMASTPQQVVRHHGVHVIVFVVRCPWLHRLSLTKTPHHRAPYHSVTVTVCLCPPELVRSRLAPLHSLVFSRSTMSPSGITNCSPGTHVVCWRGQRVHPFWVSIHSPWWLREERVYIPTSSPSSCSS